MVLGFKRQFAQFVREGSKTHTIRDDKNDRWKVGCIVDAFVDPRQKTMERLIPRAICVRVESIEIRIIRHGPIQDYRIQDYRDNYEITIDGVSLTNDEKDLLAYRDGFRLPDNKSHLGEMMRFWDGRLPFKGKLIHWAPLPPTVERSKPDAKPKSRSRPK